MLPFPYYVTIPSYLCGHSSPLFAAFFSLHCYHSPPDFVVIPHLSLLPFPSYLCCQVTLKQCYSAHARFSGFEATLEESVSVHSSVGSQRAYLTNCRFLLVV